MIPTRLVINSESTGKFVEREINGRPHIVTTMVSIEGDTVMNQIFYPASEVANSHQQFNNLLAPADHPMLNGKLVSANEPFAVNQNNIGAIVLNPRLDGNQVINDLAVDVEVANRDKRGVEVIKRIKNGEKLGVSSGGTGELVAEEGKHFGAPFKFKVANLKWDHVALLLADAPAGENTFVLNSDQTVICNFKGSVNTVREKLHILVQERFGSDDRFVHIEEMTSNPDRVIVGFDDRLVLVPFMQGTAGLELTGTGIDVKRVFQPVENEASEMDKFDKEKLALSMIGNSHSALTVNDLPALLLLDELQLVNKLADSFSYPITDKMAKDHLKDSGVVDVDEFLANKAEFTEFLANKVSERQATIDKIVKGSKMAAADLEGLPDDSLDRLVNSLVTKPQSYLGNGAESGGNDSGAPRKTDYTN